MFRGTFTALVTPFRADGTLDEDGVIRLLEHQLKSGVQGVVLCGTTGEEASLSLDERKRLVEIVQKRAEGHIYTVVSASDNITERAVQLAREMDWLGVDAILSVVPYFIRPNQAGIVEHFRRIADAVQTPLIVSNAPARAGTGLEADTVSLLAEHENIRGIDESSGDLDFLSNILAATDEELGIFAGEDTLTLPMIALGADGAFSLVSNEVPDKMSALVNAALDGRFADARDLHYELFDLMTINYVDRNPIPVKAALAMMGLTEENYRLPLLSIDDVKREQIKKALVELDLI
ncbi:MAG: 4-hydroxy-tetrahydrodipicolinate synthase [Acidobacteria bacterium]|nr:MAG: 4-hydroxy-tetrahydrodipicolinate synthase [Acidobacteriota bacterium]